MTRRTDCLGLMRYLAGLLLCIVGLLPGQPAAQEPVKATEPVERHAMELRANSDPEGVRRDLPPLIKAAIDAKDLKAIPLGDSDKIKDGQAVVALGNPQGLKHSVVSGIVSGTREIEGRSVGFGETRDEIHHKNRQQWQPVP